MERTPTRFQLFFLFSNIWIRPFPGSFPFFPHAAVVTLAKSQQILFAGTVNPRKALETFVAILIKIKIEPPLVSAAFKVAIVFMHLCPVTMMPILKALNQGVEAV